MSDWRSFYDTASETYDSWSRDQAWTSNIHLRRVLSDLGPTPRRVLDLGTGTGQTAEVLKSLYPQAELTLVDQSPRMLDRARRRVSSAAVVLADVDDFLTETTETYDLVVSVGVLELLPYLPATVANAARLLPEGGHLVATYEPLLPVAGLQRARTSLPIADEGPVVRRWPHGVPAAVAAVVGLEPVVELTFPAFDRYDGSPPAVHGLVAWRKGQASGAT